MPKADRVLSTPPTNASAISLGAPGADQLSPSSLIPASPPAACQTGRDPIEPKCVVSNCEVQAGGVFLSRRSLMNKMVSAAAVASGVPFSLSQAAPIDESRVDDHSLIELAERAIAAFKAYQDSGDNFYRPERIMAKWLRNNPQPKRPAGGGINGSVEYEKWFKKFAEAETEEESEALLAVHPKRDEMEALRKWNEDIAAWNARAKTMERLSGLEAAEQEHDRLHRVYRELADQVMQAQVTSLQDLIAKARTSYYGEFDLNGDLVLIKEICELFPRSAVH
jgi:hypothetical protein